MTRSVVITKGLIFECAVGTRPRSFFNSLFILLPLVNSMGFLGGKETKVSSFTRLKCTALRFGLAKFTFHFLVSGRKARQGLLSNNNSGERGGENVWVFLMLMK